MFKFACYGLFDEHGVITHFFKTKVLAEASGAPADKIKMLYYFDRKEAQPKPQEN
jgi:hypothetical protein